MLNPYRVVDLTDEGALICGQILGDLGADVILVEPPGGVKARSVGPFAGDQHDQNKSLNYWALNRRPRSPRASRRPSSTTARHSRSRPAQV